jgi:uncharacterized protein (TIGR03437 family)
MPCSSLHLPWRTAGILCGFAVAIVSAGAQPAINANGIVNSASYLAPGLPGSGIAQGSIFTISGKGLGPATATAAPGVFPLPTTLAGTSVVITAGGAQSKAVILYTSDQQVAAILPSTIPVGKATVAVTFGSATSQPATIQVVTSSFGIFTFNQSGFGQAVVSDTAYRANTIVHTFHPGDLAVLWGTGIGPIESSDSGAPPTGNIGAAQVYVGNTTATVQYHGRSGCCAGVDQIVFEVPAGVEGCYVPVGVHAGDAMSNIATIAVSSSGETCSDSILGADLIAKLASGQTVNFGYLRLEEGLVGDVGLGTFSQYTQETAGLAQYGVSSGYCMSCQSGTLACRVGLSDFSPGQIDAGPTLTVQGFGRTVTVPKYGPGYYFGTLNASDGSRYLWGGLNYSMTGDGGSVVGSFTVAETLNSTAALISSPGAGQSVSLKNDLTVQWSGGNPNQQNGFFTIAGVSFADAAETQYVEFQCTAPVSATQFTVPAWVLSTLPVSATTQNGTETIPLGYIWIGEYDTPTTFQAKGLDRGIITDIFYLPRNVMYH